MTPLESAKALRFTAWEDSCNWTCESCGASTTDDYEDEGFPHTPTCPWLVLPQIVAALEAAEKVVRALQSGGGWGERGAAVLNAASDLADAVLPPPTT